MEEKIDEANLLNSILNETEDDKDQYFQSLVVFVCNRNMLNVIILHRKSLQQN